MSTSFIPFSIAIADQLPIQRILNTGLEHFEETLLDAFETNTHSQLKQGLEPHFRAVQLFHELDYTNKPQTFADLFSRIGFLFKSNTEEAQYMAAGDESIAACLKEIDPNLDDEKYARILCNKLTHSSLPVKKTEEVPQYKVDYRPSLCKIVFLIEPTDRNLLKSIFPAARIALNFKTITKDQISDWISLFRANKNNAEQVVDLHINEDCDFAELISCFPNLKK